MSDPKRALPRLRRRRWTAATSSAPRRQPPRRPPACRCSPRRGPRRRPVAEQSRRDRRQGPVRHAHRRAEEGGLLRLGLQGRQAAACCAPTSPTTGRSPSRTSAATSTPRSSRTSSTTSSRGSSTPSGTPSSSSSSRTTPAARSGAQDQSIAIFGKPGDGKFEFVMTGRHMTLRADGNSTEHVAFGGPIFYGHAASGFNEKVRPPRQRLLAAGRDGQQGLPDARRQAAGAGPGGASAAEESAVGFQGAKGTFPGLAGRRAGRRAEEGAAKGAGRCWSSRSARRTRTRRWRASRSRAAWTSASLTFYKEGDLGDDGEWDNWRLEGPSFVWYFRGTPHVHVWVNVADDPTVKLNARG